MQGTGVTNYDSKPSYGFSAATTEWDDALMKRGIRTHEQAMIAKGASPAEASRLTQLKEGTDTNRETEWDTGKQSPDEGDESDDEDFLDDDFLVQYRQQRLHELQSEQSAKTKKGTNFGAVIPISRSEWTREVNEASQENGGIWVIVCLTTSDTERTGAVEHAVRELAFVCTKLKFVSIPSHHAIPNWPESNLPSLFLYRNGTMQHELLRLPQNTNKDDLEEHLKQLGVLDDA